MSPRVSRPTHIASRFASRVASRFPGWLTGTTWTRSHPHHRSAEHAESDFAVRHEPLPAGPRGLFHLTGAERWPRNRPRDGRADDGQSRKPRPHRSPAWGLAL